jgi:hypothetical protein
MAFSSGPQNTMTIGTMMKWATPRLNKALDNVPQLLRKDVYREEFVAIRKKGVAMFHLSKRFGSFQRKTGSAEHDRYA